MNAISLKFSLLFKNFLGWKYFCPLCQRWAGSFKPYGIVQRKNAKCPNCGSLERHRYAWIFLNEKTNLFDSADKKMLHFAPEEAFKKKFENIPNLEYITTDLKSKKVMINMDITNIKYSDNYFDIVMCSHVLEHIPDDRKAMSEIFRVLKPNGWALIMVPINKDKTFEDPTITDENLKLKLFGNKHHVRKYGTDIIYRLQETGFKVRRYNARDFIDEKDLERMNVNKYPLFYSKKEI